MSGKKYIIEGGVPLKGEVKISGAKNAVIKEIAASLLTHGQLTLENVPAISDVEVDLEIIKSLGVEISRSPGVLILRPRISLENEVPAELSCQSRGSIIVMGPLLAREGRVSLPAPGGCAIGERPLDRHLAGLESLGAKFEVKKDRIIGSTKGLRGGRVVFKKNTVMGTENVVLAAVLAEGETEILGAAQEPEVEDLIHLLNEMGALIERDPENPRILRIQGVQSLRGAKHRVLPDRNEAVTFAVAAAITGGDVLLTNLITADLTAFLAKLQKIGVSWEVVGKNLRVFVKESSVFEPVEIETSPHPGFMTDWQQPLTVLLTQSKGSSLVHETVYEDRWKYLTELKKFGAQIELFTPSQLGRDFVPDDYEFNWEGSGEPKSVAKISGPTPLKGAKVQITDLRAGAALVLAALAAQGKSEVSGVEHIERGYENFEQKLKALGARIE
ncbi:UDP-N-acetylglucosamine 1-carboxyvinyltransferase [candidate division WWE3 bacterium RBG_19FT_COMBO_53_11]|uniref:UDP-N-acetylglucosamine 1-carboxyvinyltransferase n=1 Tax=candidate division WWE3 bacterium RBG_19FT_COMBO_53_11 TaxID=1802613 RepID=A0A1F4UI24_UNCKA|nr:MAG: UDP-N-acetylglucosamine 1-carboxyvinyltransferase [candidate division WWE3 bacterium RBG_16_52_45]OGC44604.1 MAG: UDP-N-acetylglucosamine 1-carboxyvinyltransferase [candidate division WWE3 bacterium RBG_19FT_COMBO_53_11]